MRVVRRVTIPSPDKSRPPLKAHPHNLTVLKLRAERIGGGLTLLSGGGEGEVKVWKVKAGQPVHFGTLRIPRVTKRSARPLIKVRARSERGGGALTNEAGEGRGGAAMNRDCITGRYGFHE
jgi:hypothetical protein